MFKHALLAAALTFATQAVIAKPVEYKIDPGHTQVYATYSHLGLSNITIRFNTVEGTFIYDAEKPENSKVDVSVPISSLDTGIERFDKHMWSGDLFDAEKFPAATFKSESVKAKGKGKFVMTGVLTIKGVSKTVTFDVVLNGKGEHPRLKTPAVGFDATTKIKRSEFNLGYGVPNVGDEVQLRITMEAVAPKQG